MKRNPDWMPAIFCATLSAITLASGLAMAFMTKATFMNGLIPFLCFLPMCFFLVGSATSALRKENAALRNDIDELRRLVTTDTTVA